MAWHQTNLLEAIVLSQIKRFLKDENGTAAVEYGLIVSGISLVILPTVNGLGVKLVNVFSTLQRAL